MPLIEILSRWSSSVLFRLDAEPNTVRLTLEAAVTARADLGGANLRGADLGGANLRDADLGGANLRDADLGGANLRAANLGGADLGGADLGGANLRGANLGDANLRDADLGGANLRAANLGGADLGGADLGGADLRGADLGAANLGAANLGAANLGGAKNMALALARTSIVPESGAFEGWKLCANNVLVHLRIPADAARSNATGRKCRAAAVEVIEVIGAEEGVSIHDEKTIYRTGEVVHCDHWDSNRWEECSGGIHFYLTRIEAQHHP
jgi:hypothetical protein